jgi:hypothetical protein
MYTEEGNCKSCQKSAGGKSTLVYLTAKFGYVGEFHRAISTVLSEDSSGFNEVLLKRVSAPLFNAIAVP